MFELGKIAIYKAIIHTFNKEYGEPLISTSEIDHNDDFTFQMLTSSIEKIYISDSMKWAIFDGSSNIKNKLNPLKQDENLFSAITKDLSYIIQDIIHKYREVLPSCDIAFILFKMEKELYLGCIKLNHKDLFIRKSESTKEGLSTTIGRSNDLYLNKKPKLEEGFVLNLESNEIALLDKSYNINGEKMYLFENIILKLNTNMSEKEKLQLFNQINKRIQKKFIGENIAQKAHIKLAIANTIVEEGCIDTKKVLDRVFEDDKEIKSIYHEAFQKANISNQQIKLNELAARKYDTQKIVTTEGIEINVPVELCKDSKLELVRNKNGSIDIVIKDVEEYKVL